MDVSLLNGDVRSSRTRLGTTIESLSDVSVSATPIDILRRICEQCALTDIEYFDPVLCDGVCASEHCHAFVMKVGSPLDSRSIDEV